MNHPKQLSPQRLLSLLVCISFITTASTSLLGQQVIRRTYPAYGQPLQSTPVYRSPGVPVIRPQAPIQNGRIIMSQPVPVQNRRIISSQPIPIQNGRIINGRIINGQPIPIQSGRIINGPIISGPITQPGVVITPQITSQPQSVIVDAANVNQDDEIKRLNAEIKRLEALALGNGEQSQQVKRLQRELYKARLDLSEMQKSAAAQPDDTSSATMELNGKIQQQQKEIDRLSGDYQTAFQRNEALSSQIKSLADESSRLKAQLSKPDDSQVANAMELQQLRSNLTSTSTALKETKQKNEAMTTEYNRLRGEYDRVQNLNETANTDNANLNQRIDEMSLENQRFELQLNEYANAKGVNAITEVDPVVVRQTSFAADRRVENQGSATADLKRKNRQLLGLNEQVNQQNKLLNRRIAELEGNVNELSIDDDDRGVATTSVASTFGDGLYNPSVQADVPRGKYNIMRWLIPFLGIGLFVGLYVFLTEEYLGTSRALITGGDDRDDRHKRHRS